MSTPPSINFMSEIKVMMNIIKAKRRSLILARIIIIAILCITIMTNNLAGKGKETKKKIENIITPVIILNLNIVIVARTISTDVIK